MRAGLDVRLEGGRATEFARVELGSGVPAGGNSGNCKIVTRHQAPYSIRHEGMERTSNTLELDCASTEAAHSETMGRNANIILEAPL